MVTGSCHLLELGGAPILVDCGLFQGDAAFERSNHEPFPFRPADLTAVLLTHGHLDHVGRLPLLVNRGYRGPIYTTAMTKAVAEVILKDAAKLQRERFARDLRRARRAGLAHEVREPYYSEADVEQTLTQVQGIAQLEQPFRVGKVDVRFRHAGHILGSAFIELSCAEGRVTVSGDLGNRESGVQEDAALPGACDAVLIETTYADRTHRSLEATLAEFSEVVRRSLATGGKVVIPSFALERAQNLLYHLKRLTDTGELPRVPIFLDSPMAIKLTRLYAESKNTFSPEITALFDAGINPFRPEILENAVSNADSRRINDLRGSAIILAGSGMMTGGRVLHHLKHNLWRKEASVIVVSYQADGTLGRQLVDGAKRVSIMGEEIVVRASVHTIGGFSSHADQGDLLAWLGPTAPAHAYLVHGEPDVTRGFANKLATLDRHATSVVKDDEYQLS